MYGTPAPPVGMYGTPPPPPVDMYGTPPPPVGMYGTPPPPPVDMYGAPPPPPNNTYGVPQNTTKPIEGKPLITYYRFGRKLWLLPLYAGVVFIAHVLLLLLKAISRHKILAPYSFYTSIHSRNLNSYSQRELDNTTEHVTKALDIAAHKFM
jgi:hypothetical protein